MNNMTLRAISGAVYVALIVAAILLGGICLACFFALMAFLAVNELECMMKQADGSGRCVRLFDAVIAGVLVLSLTAGVHCREFRAALFAGALIFLLYIPVRMTVAVMSRSTCAAKSAGVAFASLIYIVFPILMFTMAAALAPNAMASKMFMLMVFVAIWVNDTGAYLAGRAFGRRKLCERLSPKKTVEGFVGGMVFAMLVPAVVAVCYTSRPGWIIAAAVFGAVVSLAATVGDLFESLIKRSLGVKDSGNLIPGHGGILDRIDSFLAVGPLAALLAMLSSLIIF